MAVAATETSRSSWRNDAAVGRFSNTGNAVKMVHNAVRNAVRNNPDSRGSLAP
jgi:hypothetical protein